MPKILTALLGLGLAGLAIYSFGYGAPGWFYSAQGAAALVALSGAALLRSDDFTGVATLPFLGIVLFAVWLFSLGGQTPAWLRWLNLLASLGFFAATLIAIVPHRQRFHLGSPAWRT
jgi:hypothetical protein